MAKAKLGDTVEVHYKSSIEGSDTFEMTEPDQPLSFTLGKKEVILGFEKAILGMQVGEEKILTLASDEAYGDYDPQLRRIFQRTEIPESVQLEVGKTMRIAAEGGQVVNAIVTEFDDKTVTLDANDPCAGKNLDFTIELAAILNK